MKIKEYKEELLLAGKLAIVSELLLDSNIYDWGDRIQVLSIALQDYNNYIFSHR